jgi:CheY-like chemotaxis protein
LASGSASAFRAEPRTARVALVTPTRAHRAAGALRMYPGPGVNRPQLQVGSTILIVDDDEDITITLADVLEADGYRVLTANDGIEALRLLGQQAPIHLLLVDLWMPGMSGSQFIAEVKQDPKLANIAILVMSASADNDPPVPTSDFIRKPVGLEALLNAVRWKCAGVPP